MKISGDARGRRAGRGKPALRLHSAYILLVLYLEQLLLLLVSIPRTIGAAIDILHFENLAGLHPRRGPFTRNLLHLTISSQYLKSIFFFFFFF